MIRPELNSYIVVHVPPEKPGGRGGDIDGRVRELLEGHPIALTRRDEALYSHAGIWYYKPSSTAPHSVLAGARLTHCHHQPPEADDSPAWILTRDAVRRAMARAKGALSPTPPPKEPPSPTEDGPA